MEDLNKLDYGLLLLENLFKISKKDNLDLKINQVKETIYTNFNEIEEIVNKTTELKNEYNLFEKNIRSNLDIFYNKLRSYEIEQKNKMEKVWLNLFDNLSNIKKEYIDIKLKILNDIGDKDKCFIILSKLFDIFEKKKINIIDNSENNNYFIMKDNENIGSLKKCKDKINMILNDNISLIFKNKQDDSNFKFLEYLLN